MKSWHQIIREEQVKDYYKNIVKKIKEDLETKEVFPLTENIFNAFKLCPYNKLKIVLLGQDPYHNPGEAHGLSFSVMPGIKIPPSLQNIYKELKADLDIDPPIHGCLSAWAKQGVLLLNTSLTVRKNEPNSHKDIGWSIFTDKIISIINEKETPVVFILWGNNAKQKKKLITNPIHLILESAHPSPFSAYSGFFGSKPFSKANEFLIKNDIYPIDWKII
jgi:uracil-DNA glycosylase